jgi:hypothetical protein
MTQKYDEAEYLDTMVTLELAMRFAQREGRQVNGAIRQCWFTIRHRITNELNRRVFDGLATQPFTQGALCMMRRMLDESI